MVSVNGPYGVQLQIPAEQAGTLLGKLLWHQPATKSSGTARPSRSHKDAGKSAAAKGSGAKGTTAKGATLGAGQAAAAQ